MSEQCPADVNGDDSASLGSPAPQPSGLPPSLPEAIWHLASALAQTNDLLSQILVQNQQMLAMWIEQSEGEDEAPAGTYLDGTPIHGTG